METLEKGKRYIFLGIPMWFAGTLERETVFHWVLSADTAEFLPDADNLKAYISRRVKGEMLGKRVYVQRDGTTPIEGE